MATNKKRAINRAEKFRGWLLLDAKNRLLYEKEIIPEGDFGKLDSSGEGIAFAVRRNILNHWQKSLRDLRAAGIKSPFAKTHETWDQPEDRLGELVDADVRENDKGEPSLFLRILFDDEKSRDIGLKGDVSIGSPETWYDGRKQKWDWPLQHVASTNAPVIPGLEPWRKIAASFSATNKPKGSKMDLDELIAALGIEVDESVNTDDGKKALVLAKLKELTGGAPAPNADGTPDPKEVDMSHGDDDELKPKAPGAPSPAVPQAKKVTVAFAHPVIVSTVRDARLSQLDSLVEQRIITPATKKELVLSFCTDEKLKIELAHDSEGKPIGDGKAFENAIKLVKLVAKDRPLNASGRSAAGDGDDETTIELSHSDKSKDVLTRNAEKRAKAAAAR